jgi:hypothetical protein
MSVALLLVHGDDSLELDETVAAFARRVSDGQKTEIVPERSPDEAAIDRAGPSWRRGSGDAPRWPA